MNEVYAESVPLYWFNARDVPFFRLTASVFPPEFLAGAGVLLASFDPESIATITHTERDQLISDVLG